MTDRIPTIGAIEGEMRLPLPGLYPVLTMQLNVTLHRASREGKFVAALREPTDQVELTRAFSNLAPWTDIYTQALGASMRLIGDMGYLMGIPNP